MAVKPAVPITMASRVEMLAGSTLTSGTYSNSTFTQDTSNAGGSVTIGSSNDSLSGIASAINSAGIGVTAIQLAGAFGATVFTTVGSEAKADACRRLGAAAAITYRTQDFAAEVLRLTDGRGVDVVLDMVGAPYFPRNLRVLAKDGRLVQIAFLHGATVESFDLSPIMLRRLTVTGSTMRPRSTAEKGVIARALREQVWPLLDQGRCSPVIHRVFPLAEAAAAHALLESGTHIGKIVLQVGA